MGQPCKALYSEGCERDTEHESGFCEKHRPSLNKTIWVIHQMKRSKCWRMQPWIGRPFEYATVSDWTNTNSEAYRFQESKIGVFSGADIPGTKGLTFDEAKAFLVEKGFPTDRITEPAPPEPPEPYDPDKDFGTDAKAARKMVDGLKLYGPNWGATEIQGVVVFVGPGAPMTLSHTMYKPSILEKGVQLGLLEKRALSIGSIEGVTEMETYAVKAKN